MTKNDFPAYTRADRKGLFGFGAEALNWNGDGSRDGFQGRGQGNSFMSLFISLTENLKKESRIPAVGWGWSHCYHEFEGNPKTDSRHLRSVSFFALPAPFLCHQKWYILYLPFHINMVKLGTVKPRNSAFQGTGQNYASYRGSFYYQYINNYENTCNLYTLFAELS